MSTTRRGFLRGSLEVLGALGAAGALGAGAAACRRSSKPAPPGAKPRPPTPRAPPFEAAYLKAERTGVLGRREEQLWEILRSCKLCPRGCGANRLAGAQGVCRSTAKLVIHSAGPHRGEERPIAGTGGSGTVFFSACNLRCCFCQNWEINHRGDGRVVTHQELARVMVGLQKKGCHNINLVTPTHVVPHIVRAVRLAIPQGLTVPLVYNTSAYDRLSTVKTLDGIVDIYLPDFKYQDGALAAKYSAGARDYPQVAAQAIREMNRQVGALVADGRSIAKRGLLVRHLVMPHNVAGTDRFVRWARGNLSTNVAINIMAQYRPEHRASEYPKIARPLSRAELRQALQWAQQAGLRYRADTDLHFL